MDSQRRRKHSSGRIPVSIRTVTIDDVSSEAAAKYRASSFVDITRSLCRSPGKSLIFGADGTVPHSNANFNIRRRTRRELLTELTCSFCDSRFAENAAIFLVVISSRLQSGSGLK